MAISADSRISLLLVDGDQQSNRALTCSLDNAGFHVISVHTAEAARAYLAQEIPQLILSDTFLVEGDGYALCRWVKARPSFERTPFMFVTSNTSDEARAEAIAAGCDEYLVKPLYVRQVVSRLHALLERRRIVQPDQQEAMSGLLSQLSVVDLIQLMELRARTGVVTLLSSTGDGGKLCFRDGVLVDAELGHLRGEEAALGLLCWSEGRFQLVHEQAGYEERIRRSSSALILDWVNQQSGGGNGASDEGGADDSLVLHSAELPQDQVASTSGVTARAPDETPTAAARKDVAVEVSGLARSSRQASRPRQASSRSHQRAAMTSLPPPVRRGRVLGWTLALGLLCFGAAVLPTWLRRGPWAPDTVQARSASGKTAGVVQDRSAKGEAPALGAQESARSGVRAGHARAPASVEPPAPVDRADELDRNGADAHEAAAILRVRAQLLADAGRARALTQMVRERAEQWRVFEALALQELSRGRTRQALAVAQAVIRVHEQAPRAHLVVGVVAHEDGQTHAARRAYQRYLALCDGCAFAKEVRSVLSRIDMR